MNTLEFHPLANLFPMMTGSAADDLETDIAVRGIVDQIVILDGMIIDGRNRYRAGLGAQVFAPDVDWRTDPNFVEFSPDWGDPLNWVLSKNLHRRQLTTSQLAMVAANLANMRQGERTDLTDDEQTDEPSANLPKVAVEDAADRLNVSARSVTSARHVLEHGADVLQDAVTKGDIKVSAAAELADLPLEAQVALIESADPKALGKVIKAQRDAKTAAKKLARVVREQDLGQKQLTAGDRKFGVILADDEWEHEPWSDAGLAKAAANHNPVSSLEALKLRPVGDLAADDCVLFMWSTVPHLAQALELMTARGFAYKSQFIWSKRYNGKRQGMGYWARINHEILLVGTRGKVPAPAPGTQWPSLIEAPVGAHSAKPDWQYHLVEAYFPSLPKLELNKRGVPRDGWCAWGNEVAGDPERGVGMDINGFADASHLPCPASPERPVLRQTQDEAGTAVAEGDGRAGGESAPQLESKTTPHPESKTTPHPKPKTTPHPELVEGRGVAKPTPKRKPKPPKPVCLNVVGASPALALLGLQSVKFYATDQDKPFLAAEGWCEVPFAGASEVVDPQTIAQGLYDKAWAEVWAGAIPLIVHKMGRVGPVPVRGAAS